MDALKGLASKLGSSGSSSNTGNAAPAGNAGQQDYVDKGVSALASKLGHPLDRNTEEKITDFGREKYEAVSGKHVSDKISN